MACIYTTFEWPKKRAPVYHPKQPGSISDKTDTLMQGTITETS